MQELIILFRCISGVRVDPVSPNNFPRKYCSSLENLPFVTSWGAQREDMSALLTQGIYCSVEQYPLVRGNRTPCHESLSNFI